MNEPWAGRGYPASTPGSVTPGQGYAEWRGWLDAQGYDFDDDSYQAEAFAAGMQAQRDLDAAQQPQPAPVTVDALAAALDGREIVVSTGTGWERRKARDPRALAAELLGAIDSRLTEAPKPQPAPASASQARRHAAMTEPERAAAMAALAEVAASHERVMYAAWIDVTHGDPNDAATILAEQLDGFDGPQWNGTETGEEWLERTRDAQ